MTSTNANASAAAAAAPPAQAAVTTAYDAGFDEDDEFEEFEDEDWPVGESNDNKEVEWADDWDDDLVEGDFVTQLRQELTNKAATKQ